jgi:peptidyl-prolyl cis-trans isomerase D
VGYVGYGAYSAGAADSGAVAVVGGEKIKTAAFNRVVKSLEMKQRRQGKDVEDADMEQIKQDALQGLLYESAMVQGAEKYGMNVSDFELAYSIRTAPEFNYNGTFDKKVYVWTVRNQFNMNPADFEEQQRRILLMQRFANLLASANRATPEEIKYNFKTQYGGLKDFDSKKTDFITTVEETKANAAQTAFLADFNANNSVKILLKE